MTRLYKLIPMIAWVGARVPVVHAVCYRIIVKIIQRDAHKCVKQLDK